MSRLRETTAALLIAVFMISSFAVMCEAKSSLVPIQASSGTEVGGIITENTIWSEEEYLVTASILVPEGITLEITPGVSINFQNFFIQIDGTLRIRGVPENKIIINFTHTHEPSILFTDSSIDYDPLTEEGCIIENAIITSHNVKTWLIEISYCSPKISSNILTNYHSLLGSIIYITHSPGAVISSNILTNYHSVVGSVIHIRRSSGAVIVNNHIKYGEVGISIGSSDDNIRGPIIAYNTIQNSSIGIDSFGGTPIIKNNLITGNNYFGVKSSGIATGGSPIITYNVIKNNSVGLTVSNHASIYYNNIYDNEEYNAQLSEEIIEDVNVTHNWWGSTEEEEIELKLYDYQDFFRLSNLVYVPFLEEPINETSVGIQSLEPEIESEPEPEPSKPAEFVVSDLSITPLHPLISQDRFGVDVNFSVKVTNIGDKEGSYTVDFKVRWLDQGWDWETIDIQTVTLARGDSTTVFYEETWSAGTYQVNVENLTLNFTVEDPEPEPESSFLDKIPGFPYESIILGLIAVIIIIWRVLPSPCGTSTWRGTGEKND